MCYCLPEDYTHVHFRSELIGHVGQALSQEEKKKKQKKKKQKKKKQKKKKKKKCLNK